MADPETPGEPEVTPEKPAKAPRAKVKPAEVPEPPDAGINASIIGDPHGPRQDPDLDPDDPGINANVAF